MTKHEFLVFLAESYDHYGEWPAPEVFYADLRFNTPEGQVRWDQQARALIVRMLKKGLIEKVSCAGAKKGRPDACKRPHLALTVLGRAQLDVWNDMGCDSHTHVANCHAADREFEFNKKKVG